MEAKVDPKIEEELNKSKESDARQSFVEQVSLGLSKKVPAERFERAESFEHAKSGVLTKADTHEVSPAELDQAAAAKKAKAAD